MILWPAGLALVAVWVVFRDPAIDHRLVVAGVLLPDLVDVPFGGSAGVAHTLAASVVLLLAVMIGTRHRRRARRRLLALPIGTFLHLVVDGAWARTAMFWWPAFGSDIPGRIPALDRPVEVLLLQELVGAAALVWCWRTFGLGDPAAREKFVRRGRLEAVAGPARRPPADERPRR